MNDDCLFCQIANDPDKVIWENHGYVAFKDIHPKAKLHLLVAPKAHIENYDNLPAEMSPALTLAVQEVAQSQGVSGGYRIQVNVGRRGGQEIDHLHVHLLAD